jgi:hypothetical protein
MTATMHKGNGLSGTRRAFDHLMPRAKSQGKARLYFIKRPHLPFKPLHPGTVPDGKIDFGVRRDHKA